MKLIIALFALAYFTGAMLTLKHLEAYDIGAATKVYAALIWPAAWAGGE